MQYRGKFQQALAEGVRHRGKDIGEYEDSRRKEAGVEGFTKCERECVAQAMVRLRNYREIITKFQAPLKFSQSKNL